MQFFQISDHSDQYGIHHVKREGARIISNFILAPAVCDLKGAFTRRGFRVDSSEVKIYREKIKCPNQ